MGTRAYPELLDLSLAEAARRIKRRELSPVELVDATLHRIASVNPRLSAYITVFEEQARQVGVLAGKAAHDDIVDVTVVEGAIRRHDAVVTSNEDHIRSVADAAKARLRIERI